MRPSRQIPDGSRVFFGHAANEPPVLVDALVRNYEQYKDVEIVRLVPMGKEYCDPKMKGHLRHNAMFVGGPTRKAVQEGRADYTPFFFHQSTPISSLTAPSPLTWPMVSVTPPDKHASVPGRLRGRHQAACLNAKMVIAQVNDRCPAPWGVLPSRLPADLLCGGIHASAGAGRRHHRRSGGSHRPECASLVEDGSTLQLGIGTILMRC